MVANRHGPIVSNDGSHIASSVEDQHKIAGMNTKFEHELKAKSLGR
jgi:hypothetical protein